MARRGLFGRGRKRDASAAGTTMYGTGRCGMAFWRSVCGPLRSMGLCRSNNIGRGCSGQGASKGMSTIQLFSTLSCCSLAASSVIGCKDLICHDRIVCECVLWRLRLLVVWFTLLSANFRPRVLHHLRSTTTTPPPTFRQTMAQESSFLTMPSPAQMSSATQQQPPVVASSGQAPGHPSFRRQRASRACETCHARKVRCLVLPTACIHLCSYPRLRLVIDICAGPLRRS
ncbi:hypothetical protein HDK90DRAFT_103852 [Phyllosticta capitalensis]|uniref:Zn(2)-C6 fungal-type domain-containing protein n=1 Tax=Phyllosticta capitalensis TaxID=121624 RepID=A0ABR1YBC9_9PEZI